MMKSSKRNVAALFILLGLTSCDWVNDVQKKAFSQMDPFLSGSIFIESINLNANGRLTSCFDEKLDIDILKPLKDIESISYRSFSIARISTEMGASPKILFGIDFPGDLFAKQSTITEGKQEPDNGASVVYISQNTAKEMNCSIGDTIAVELKTINGQANMVHLPIGGFFKSTNLTVDNYIYTDRATLNRCIGLENDQYQLICVSPKKKKDIKIQLQSMLASKSGKKVVLADNYLKTMLDARNSESNGSVLFLYTNISFVAELYQRVEYENRKFLESPIHAYAENADQNAGADSIFD
jgi:hypothetical protein